MWQARHCNTPQLWTESKRLGRFLICWAPCAQNRRLRFASESKHPRRHRPSRSPCAITISIGGSPEVGAAGCRRSRSIRRRRHWSAISRTADGSGASAPIRLASASMTFSTRGAGRRFLTESTNWPITGDGSASAFHHPKFRSEALNQSIEELRARRSRADRSR